MRTADARHRAKYNLPEGCPIYSPWGTVDHGRKIADGIFIVSTPGHGGIKLFPEQNERIPINFRISSGWYEEDCDWAIVAYFFKEHFPDHHETAITSLKNWHWRQWESYTGKPIPAGESFQKERHVFEEQNADKWIVICAFGDWHRDVPKGMVGVIATKGGKRGDGRSRPKENHYLVKAEVYAKKGPHGFVVDDNPHEPWGYNCY